MSQNAASDVFTLEEAASYLKLPLDTIEREANRGHIPGRRIEDTWRFLLSMSEVIEGYRKAKSFWYRFHLPIWSGKEKNDE
jgi:excisionase family DNA binding protein